MIARGRWNVHWGAVGIVGCGKTTWNVTQLLRLADHNQVYLLAHDPDHRIPPRLPSGREVVVRHYRTEGALLAGLKEEPRAIHALDSEDAFDVVLLGERLAAASLKQHGGDRGVPVMVYLDEAIKVREMSPAAPPRKLLDKLTGRRWLNMGFAWGSQSPQYVHPQVMGECKSLAIFRVPKRAIDNLDKAGVDEEILAVATTLPEFTCKVQTFGFR